MNLSVSERDMWREETVIPTPAITDEQINERYVRGEGRIVIETNREKLPGFVKQLEDPNYLDLSPFYQRRPRWSIAKKSLLIESFILNIPVPSIFLYERDYNSYEVMDGQQRISAIRDFYNNKFRLRSLETWPELNGRFYKNLPDKIRAGIDRRSISSVVLLKESTVSDEEASILRETVFDRLNTGGIKLERQEIRNALYKGAFNEMLLTISRSDLFRKVWKLPIWKPDEVESGSKITKIPFYAKMSDVEMVLRFFALRHVEQYSSGMQNFLDNYMRKASAFTANDLHDLYNLYMSTLDFCHDVYGDLTFVPFHSSKMDWFKGPHAAFHDAVMIVFSENLSSKDYILKNRDKIISSTREMFIDRDTESFTGKGNTKADIKNRISIFRGMIQANII